MFKRTIELTLTTLGLSLAFAVGCDSDPPVAETGTGTDTDTGTTGDPTTNETLDSSSSGGDPCDECASEASCMEGKCVCNSGFVGDGLTCDDADECEDGSNDCDANATCSNTPGSFECACNRGFVGDGQSCEPATTCADDPCDPNAECSDTPDGFECVCNDGFDGDGSRCTDVDECADDPCDADATCTNIDGSFECDCNDGYEGDGRDCVDIDECDAAPCDVNATCTNNDGAFECDCNQDYTGDGFTCTGTLGYFETCMDGGQCASGLCITAPYDHCSELCNQAIADDCNINLGINGFCVPIGMGDFACVGDLDTGLDNEAEVLSPGDSAMRSIGTLTDKDLFHLEVGVGDFLLEVTPNPDDNIQVEVYDAIGQPVSVLNAGGAGVVEATILSSGASLVAFAVVRNIGNSTGSYVISFTAQP